MRTTKVGTEIYSVSKTQLKRIQACCLIAGIPWQSIAARPTEADHFCRTVENRYIPSRAARILNAHHMATSAGFYGSVIGGRYFQARVKDGVLQVFDFDNWHSVTEEQARFHDHNGQEIYLH